MDDLGEYVFYMRTFDGYSLKNLFELFHVNFRHGFYTISPKGITLNMKDNTGNIIIDAQLNAENFSPYRFDHPSQKMTINIIQRHLHNTCKTVKRGDALALMISKDNPGRLCVEIKPRDANQSITSYIMIENDVQDNRIDMNDTYRHLSQIQSSAFYKLSKEIVRYDSTDIVITSRVTREENCIEFKYELEKIHQWKYTYDQPPLDSYDLFEFSKTYDGKLINNIQKISKLAKTMLIHHSPVVSVPLKISTQVGSLGRICIYIESLSDKAAREPGELTTLPV